MSQTLRIILAQFDYVVGAVEHNCAMICDQIRYARQTLQADVVVFPELAISGYPPEDLLLQQRFLDRCAQAIPKIAASTQGITAIVGWPSLDRGHLYNAASVLSDGQCLATYHKTQLPNYGVFDEYRYFAVGVPNKPCVVTIKNVRCCVLICEDLWVKEPLQWASQREVSLAIVLNASPYEQGKMSRRQTLLAQRSHDTGIAIAYVNLVGGQDSLVFDGGSLLADSDGTVHPPATCFEDLWLSADYHSLPGRFHPLNWPTTSQPTEEHLIWQAIKRGISDYCHKNGFRSVLLGLSGGIDSALVLALAVDVFGAEHVTAVRLPSQFTSDLSNDLGAQQCRCLDVQMRTLPIEMFVESARHTLTSGLNQSLTGTTDENIQSRCRGVLLMALANQTGSLLLTTGNKSEYAVGYTTIYGDMCGGYAPLKDLYKTEVYRLANWRNTQGTEPVIPSAVISRLPSAELRAAQTDQDSLPAYDVLDAILWRYIDQGESPDIIIASGYSPALVNQIIRLVRASEWKRHQAAVGPKLSRRAFGRERRYPISNQNRETDH